MTGFSRLGMAGKQGLPHLLNCRGACFFDDFELGNQQKNPDHDSADTSV